MGLKTNIVLGVIATGGLALGAGSAGYLYFNQDAKTVENTLDTFDLSTVAGRATVEGETAIALKPRMGGGNTQIIWEIAKTKPNGDRMEFDGTWSSFNGGLVYDTASQELKALEVILQSNSISGYGAEHPAPAPMIRTITGQLPPAPAWFDVTANPRAYFFSTEIIARDAVAADTAVADNAPAEWTHLVRGSFTLNGVEKPLDIAARVAFVGDNVIVELGCQIDRQAYNVDGSAVGGWTVEDTVYLSATVESAPAGDIVNQTLLAYGEKISENRALIDSMSRMENQLEELGGQIAALREQVAAGVAPAGNGGEQTPTTDLTLLPASFTDYVTYTGAEPMPFDMVLVPGDADAGIAPFYMSTLEVTWDLFYDWAYAKDIGVQEQVDLQAQDLRPSPLYEDCDQLKFGRPNRPALSMSRRTAEAFCKWLSEQTGRSYRLPTDAEWHLAVELGGGIPADRAELLAQAVFQENAAEHDDLWILMTSEVGSLAPNKLGIYDLLGNAAEWVTDTGSDRIVRGGYFDLSADDFSADWKAVEDQRVWNATYPQAPVSRFWYRDHYYQGIRLVCDPVNLPE